MKNDLVVSAHFIERKTVQASPRRTSLDTQSRLFGAPDSKPRRVRDNLRSTIFGDQVDNSPKPSPKRQVGVGNTSNGIMSIMTTYAVNGNGIMSGSSLVGDATPVTPVSCPSTPIRGTPNGSRRPSIDTKNRLFNVSSDDTSSNGSISPVPSTPVRVRQPPGGKSSIPF